MRETADEAVSTDEESSTLTGTATSSATNSPTESYSVGALALPGVIRLGKYRLVGRIGQGGMAEVFLAVSHGMGGFQKLTVVKRIRPELLEEDEFLAMFMDEARLASRLSHPNVVQTNEVSEDDGVPFIAMEYLEGQSFDRVQKLYSRKMERPLPVPESVLVCVEALRALGYAHEMKDYDGTPMNVVHRDVSPSNLFITHQGVVKLLDFGIAKAATQLHETRTGRIKGKFSYMAPEQTYGQELDCRADLWSVGVMLWEAAAGTRLFKEENDINTIRRVLTGDVPPLETVAPEAPAGLVRVVAKALQAKPEARYSSAAEMIKDLEEHYLAALPNRPMAADLAHIVNDVCAEQLERRRQQIQVAMAAVNQTAVEASPPRGSEGTTLRPGQLLWRKRGPRVAAAAAGALMLVGVAVLALNGNGVSGQSAADGQTDPSPTRHAEPPANLPLAGEPELSTPPMPTTAVAAADELAGAGEETLEDLSDEETDDSAEGAEAAEDGEEASAEESVDESRGQEDGARARMERRRRARAARLRRQEAERAAAAAAAREAEAAQRQEQQERPAPRQEVTRFGFLSIDSNPWSEVLLNGRSLGTTPLIRERLPAGTHLLVLRNPDEQVSVRYPVQIRPDEHTVRRVGLQ